MPTGWIKIEAGDITGIDDIIRGLGSVTPYLNSADAMSPAARAAGAGWLDNWNKQGARVGGWKPLKEFTIRERLARGYKAGPILYQSGQLEHGAIRPFLNWGEGQKTITSLIRATPGKQFSHLGPDRQDTMMSGNSTVVARVTPRIFGATIEGAKAMNQTGGAIPVGNKAGWTRLPARPFWFFDQQILDQAAAGILGRFEFYTFRYFPKVTGISQGGWAKGFGAPSSPSVGRGPQPGMPSGPFIPQGKRKR